MTHAASVVASCVAKHKRAAREGYVEGFVCEACLQTALDAAQRAGRREGLEEAAKVAEQRFPRGGAHTYASENADIYLANENAAEAIAEAIRDRAAQGRDKR